MKKPDQSQRYLFENHPIRGQHVSLDESWQTIAQQVGLEGRGLALLGEALAAVVLLVALLRSKAALRFKFVAAGRWDCWLLRPIQSRKLEELLVSKTRLKRE